MNEQEMPVYLFLGFLSSGKTSFIKESLDDERMNPKDARTLLIVCEDGEEEYDKDEMAKKGVFVDMIESQDKLTVDRLSSRVRKYNPTRVFVEYNGMWNLDLFYEAMPDGWMIYQQTVFADATSIIGYNSNMRQLVYDKVQNSDVVIFNRVPDGQDIMPLHKLIRGMSRGIAIYYEYQSKKTMKDDIVDPLPFDVNAPIIKIEDKDFALWFSDMGDNLDKYKGKTVEFLGMVVNQPDMPKEFIAVGRHIMTCCEADIAYNGLAVRGMDKSAYKTYDWVHIVGKISLEKCALYDGTRGPVITLISLTPGEEPEEPVATYY